MNKSYFETFQNLFTTQSFVQITLVKAIGLTPQDQGAKALVDEKGLLIGTVGGGKVEAKAINFAKELLVSNKAFDYVEWNLQKDVGMTCGGVVNLFFEVINNKRITINVFGAGHVSQALIPILATLDFNINCFDMRAEWLEKFPKFSNVTYKVSPNMADEISSLKESDYFVLITQGHQSDLPILKNILHKFQPIYLGVIGSKPKRLTLERELLEAGIKKEKISQFFCPIGLSFGSSNPNEIAISICAQILKVRDESKVQSERQFQ